MSDITSPSSDTAAAPQTAETVVVSAAALEDARAVLERAEAAFDAAEQAHGRATIEEQARLDAKEDARIADLIQRLPAYIDAAEAERNRFRLAVMNLAFGLDGAKGGHTTTVVTVRWMIAACSRENVRRIILSINAHMSHRSTETFAKWERKSDDWWDLLQAALGRPHGGTRDSEEDDLDALAAANEIINQESKTAPRPLHRDPADRSTPGPEDLGLVTPARAAIDSKYNAMNFLPLSYSADFDDALTAATLEVSDQMFPRRAPLDPIRFPSKAQLEAALRAFEDRKADRQAEARADA